MSYELMNQDENSNRRIHSAYSSNKEDNNLKIGFTEQPALNYTTNYKIHY